MTTDGDLISRYAQAGAEDAFAELVRRHLNLVYSAALRQVNGDAHLAQDVVQGVFSDLARKAASVSNRPSLASWLYTSTHFAAAKAVRTEQRRQTHEQEAVSMRELLQHSGPELDWTKLRPALDAVMHELNEADREAILLRFFEERPLAEIGGRFGLSEDAARKRVDRALDKLREHFSKRGITTTAAALSVVIAANAVQAAPIGLATSVSTAAVLAGTTFAAVSAGTTSLLTMATLKVGLTAAAVAAAAVAVPLVIQNQSQSRLRTENEALHRQVEQLAQSKGDNVVSAIAPTSSNSALANEQFDELLRLRGEVARLRQDSQEYARLNAGTADEAMTAEMNSWLARVNELKQKLEQRPDLKIPELQFLTPHDWLSVALDARLDTDADARQAFNRLRAAGKRAFLPKLQMALKGYTQANDGQLPTDISQLKPYFNPPVDDALLERYQVVRTGKASEVPAQDPTVIAEKARVDADFDSLLNVGLNAGNLKGESGGGAYGFGSQFSRVVSFGDTNSFGGGGEGKGSGGGDSRVGFGGGSSWTNAVPASH